MKNFHSFIRIEVIMMILCWQSIAAPNFISTIMQPATTQVLSFNYTVQEQTKSLGVVFSILSLRYSNVVMVASLTPIQLDLTPASLSQMYLNSDSHLQMMDLQAVISNNIQIVNIPISGLLTNFTVFFKFYNLDLPLLQIEKTYQLSIVTSTKVKTLCFLCLTGTVMNSPGSCQCSPCPEDHYGLSCHLQISTLQKNKPQQAKMFSQMNIFYRIVSPPETISLVFKESVPTNKITLYLQYQLSPGDLAGPINSYHDQEGNDHAWLITTTENTVTINTKGLSLALTLYSSENTQSTTVTLEYFDPSQISFTGIIVGVVVGLLLAIIVILVICCCLHYRRKRRQDKPLNPNILSKKQILYYYPQITASLVFPSDPLQESQSKLMEAISVQDNKTQGSKASKDRECSVCLNGIGMKSRVRVTYCGHVFHEHCLMGWFKKTQNCPTCRNDCSRTPTEETYETLRAFRSPFRKADLVRAIMSQNKHLNQPVVALANKKAGQSSIIELPQVQGGGEDNYSIEDANEYKLGVQPGGVSSSGVRRQHRRKKQGGTGFLQEEGEASATFHQEEISHSQNI